MSAVPDAAFQLSLLGPFSLTGLRGPIDLGNKKLCALLAFLICAAPEPPSRETLTTLLWGSHSGTQARHSLRQALTRLRRALGEDVFISADDTLAIRPGFFRCDVVSFDLLIHAESREARRDAVDLYQGPFLIDISILETAWTDWVTAQRQRLENLAVEGWIRIGEEEEKQGSPSRALEFAQRAIAINGLREDGHRLIIRALTADGRRTEAHSHYDHLAARLKRDLNIEPDAATAALITTIARPPQEPIQPSPVSGMPSGHGVLPSIAVLPFHYLGVTSDSDDHFADGIVEDIVAALTNLRDMLVISRTTTSIYRKRRVDPREVGRALGVRYILEGSVRKGTTAVRVSTRLCDAETGANLWGGRQEVSLGDLFTAQDHIVRDVVAGIAPNVRTAELERAMRIRPDNFTAYDHALLAQNTINSLNRQTFLQARNHLNKAMGAHSGFAMPAALSALWYIIWVGQGWSDNPRGDSDKGAALATRAIESDGRNALALATYGHLRSFLFHDYDSALAYFDRALSACANSSWAWMLSSITLSYIGRGSDAVRHAEHGLQLSPYDRNLFLYYTPLSLAHYSNGNYEDAVKWGRMSVAENPTFSAPHRYLAAALAAANRMDEARSVASHLLKLEPNFRLDQYEQTLQPFRHSEIKAQHLQHLTSAGLE